MPILRLVRTHASQEIYEAAVEKMELRTRHPLGLIMHGATFVDGEMHIAQVWDSEDYAKRYEEQIRNPTLEALMPDHHSEVTIFELKDLVTP